MSNTLVTANVHFNEDTRPVAEKFTDFVSLKIGEVDLFLMNSKQATLLALAAAEAVTILKKMENKPDDRIDDMLDAARQWMVSIHGKIDGAAIDLNASLGWTLEDWDVVLRRSTYVFMPTQKLVDEFHGRYSRQYLRGLK